MGSAFYSVEVMRRLYFWWLQKSAEEAASGFANMRRVQAGLAYRYLEVVEGLEPTRRPTFARAMTKRFYALFDSSDTLTEEERGLVRLFMEFGRVEIAPGIMAEQALPSREEQYRQTLIEEGLLSIKPDRRAIRSEIRKTFGESVGTRDPDWSGGVFQFEKRLHNLTVVTSVDTGGRNRLLGYTHLIRNRFGQSVTPAFSFLSMMGVSAETRWDLTASNNGTAAVHTALDLIGGFIREAPAIFAETE